MLLATILLLRVLGTAGVKVSTKTFTQIRTLLLLSKPFVGQHQLVIRMIAAAYLVGILLEIIVSFQVFQSSDLLSPSNVNFHLQVHGQSVS